MIASNMQFYDILQRVELLDFVLRLNVMTQTRFIHIKWAKHYQIALAIDSLCCSACKMQIASNKS